MTFAALLLLASAGFAESKTLALQIHLDRAGYSCNTIDGIWGEKSVRALGRYAASRANDGTSSKAPTPEEAYDLWFADKPEPFKIVEVTQADLDALVKIPESPAAKAELPRMGYESIQEMFAERGHLSQKGLAQMNPGVDWGKRSAGAQARDSRLSVDRRGDSGGRPRTPESSEASGRGSREDVDLSLRNHGV